MLGWFGIQCLIVEMMRSLLSIFFFQERKKAKIIERLPEKVLRIKVVNLTQAIDSVTN